MEGWKRKLAGLMAALLVLQCVPYTALAEGEDLSATMSQTESADEASSDQNQDLSDPAAEQEQEDESQELPDSSVENSGDELTGSDASSSEVTESTVADDNEPSESDADSESQPTESAPEQAPAQTSNDAAAQTPAVLSEQDDTAVQAEDVQLQDGTVVIPADADEATVKQILFEALVVNKDGLDPQSLEWEYECTGYNGLLTNVAWGPVLETFTSEKKVVFVTTTYTHPALKDNDNGTYQIRLAGTETAVTVHKVSKPSSSLTLNEDATVALPYTEDGTVDYDALRKNLFTALVASSTPDLTVDDVTIEYYATAERGAMGDLGKDWVQLEGGSKTIYQYPPISAGEHQIRISYAGNDQYSDTSSEVSVTLTERSEAPYTLKTTPDDVVLSVDSNMNVDYDAVRESVFNAVIDSSAVLTPDNVTITYQTSAIADITGAVKAWVPLEGGKFSNTGLVELTYPAMTAGTQKVQIYWGGNSQYAPTTITADINVVERSKAPYTLKDTPDEVVLSVDDNLNVDYAAVSKAVFNAVIASSDVLTPDNVTITYYAEATTGSAGDIGYGWPLLEGGKSTEYDFFNLNYPAMSAGTHTVRISWPGNQQYAPTTIETEITVVNRPEATIEVNENPSVKLALTEDLQLDTDKLYQDVFNAVVASSDPALTLDDVIITYETSSTADLAGLVKSWVPLEGEDSGTVKYPAISAGTQTVRIYWPGNKEYAPTTVETKVNVQDRDQLQFNLNDGPYEVGMVFNEEQGYDYEATAAAIYNAVVASTSPITLTAEDVTVEYNTDKNGVLDLYKPLDETDLTGLVRFGTGDWKIRISWGGNREYRSNSVVVDVTTTDNRIASNVALKSGASFTYNMDPSVMEQAIFDNVIDWDNSTLPAKDTLTPDDFDIEYKAKLTDIESGVDLGLGDLDNLIDTNALTQWVPIEGKTYSVAGTVLGSFPAMGAGDAQSIRISYKGNAEYRPSGETEGTVTVNKAKVSVSVHSTNIYADETVPADFVTTDPADKFDIYTIYAGVTSNVTTAIYLDLPDRYTNSLFLKVLDPVVEALYGKSFTQLMNDGMTLGELRQLLSTQELLDLLEKLNIDTGTFGQILTVINNLPSITDSVRVSFGAPNRAGLYTVGVVTDNKNYETGVGMGFLLVKMRLSGSKLTWNQDISGKLTAEQAKNFDFSAVLSYNGDVTVNQSGVHYLYTGFTSKWRLYSSTTTPPTEPGSYVMTVCILGGNYFALPITRTFTITK